jgi:hypothetical protein
MVRILGIDAGITGSAALYCADAPVPTVPDGMFDLPTVGEGNKKELHYAEIRNRIWALKPDVVFIEQVNAFMPKVHNPETGQMEVNQWGGTSLFRFGGAYYALRAVVSCLDLPLRTVMPGEWKRGMGLKGGKENKDASRQLVLQRYPACAPFLKFKKDQHKAESFLIAVFGARKWRREDGDDLAIPE